MTSNIRTVAEPLTLTVDANILVRNVSNEAGTRFVTDSALSLVITEHTFAEVVRHLTRRMSERVAHNPVALPPERGAVLLARAIAVAERVAVRFSLADYALYEERARYRVLDPDDWHTVALALALDLPIWTNDTHFWACGVAVWTDGSLARHLASGFA